MRVLVAGLALVVLAAGTPLAQTRRAAPAKRPEAAPVKMPADVTCPSLLGNGVTSKRSFCDVLTGRTPTDGVMVHIPPHKGTATLSFELHNRHTYSEEQIQKNRAYTRYTATVGVLTLDNNLLERGVVQSEFRTAADLVDRIEGGAAPGGVKAVAPSGDELIVVTIPQEVNEVSILGEKLAIDRLDGSATYSAPGRPIAIISRIEVEYQPAPPPPPPRRRS